MRVALICTVRNEGANILEWVAWHRIVGFTDIVVCQNDSVDRTAETLIELDRIGAITYIDNSGPAPDGKLPDSYQWRAYQHASRTDAYRKAEWCLPLDGDEFLLVKTGTGKVADLIEAVGNDADQIQLHWRNFGSGGRRKAEDGLVVELFTETDAAKRIASVMSCYKTLFRIDAFVRPGIHRPKPEPPSAERIVNGSGLRPEVWPTRQVVSCDPGLRRFAQVNHYQIKDAESFVLKRVRGRVEPMRPETASPQYFVTAERFGCRETHLAAQGEAIRAEMARLDEASGGRLFVLRRQAQLITRAMITEALSNPVLASFYRTIVELQERLRLGRA